MVIAWTKVCGWRWWWRRRRRRRRKNRYKNIKSPPAPGVTYRTSFENRYNKTQHDMILRTAQKWQHDRTSISNSQNHPGWRHDRERLSVLLVLSWVWRICRSPVVFSSQKANNAELCVSLLLARGSCWTNSELLVISRRHIRSCNATVMKELYYNSANVMFVMWCLLSAFSENWSCYRNYSVYALNQWETMLHCNVVSHWLSPLKVIHMP